MGGETSTPTFSVPTPQPQPVPQLTPPKPKLYKNPWRKPAEWNSDIHQTLIGDITAINPEFSTNVLLLGPIGAGKSSTINSILSIVKGRRVNKAYTGNKTTSFTTSFDSYMDEGFLKNCCLWDSMGIEQVLEGGLLLDDLVYLLKGNVQKDYKFNPRSAITENDQHFRRKPNVEHQIHCVVFVLDSTVVDETILGPYIEKIMALQAKTKDLNIPCVLFLTKIDQLCTEVNKDVNKTFWSIKVHDAVKTASDIFGIPEGNIHPVKNYELDIEINEATSTLILFALRQIMQYGADKVEDIQKDRQRGCIVL